MEGEKRESDLSTGYEPNRRRVDRVPFSGNPVRACSVCVMCSGNRVGVEGARALGDALTRNTTLTTLWLNSK